MIVKNIHYSKKFIKELKGLPKNIIDLAIRKKKYLKTTHCTTHYAFTSCMKNLKEFGQFLCQEIIELFLKEWKMEIYFLFLLVSMIFINIYKKFGHKKSQVLCLSANRLKAQGQW